MYQAKVVYMYCRLSALRFGLRQLAVSKCTVQLSLHHDITVVTRMAGLSIGKIEQFDVSQEDWVTYVERVEQYFIANEIPDDKRVPALLSLIGGKTYGLLRNRTAPYKPAEKTYAQILETVQRHLSPKPLTIAERFRFHKRDQRDGESVNAFVADIRKLS